MALDATVSGKGSTDARVRTRRSVPAVPLALLLAVALLAALTAAVAWGATSIPPGEVWSVVWRRLTGEAPGPAPTT